MTKTDVALRGMTHTDIEGVTQIHLACFPGYFLTHMGAEFLAAYYSMFVDHALNIGIVAVMNGAVIGFVAGTIEKDLFLQGLYRSHFWRFAIITLKKTITDPYIRSHIGRKIPQIFQGIKARIFQREAALGKMPESLDGKARLLAIAVMPNVRGNGVADALLTSFEHASVKAGAKKVYLSVKPDNLRAIGFYARQGWHTTRSSDTLLVFCKDPKPVDGTDTTAEEGAKI